MRIFGPSIAYRNGGPATSSVRIERRSAIDLNARLKRFYAVGYETLANARQRFNYRRLFVLLRREGEPSGGNSTYRLFRKEGLTVRKQKARRKAVGTRASILVEAGPNARWLLDFVRDQFANGQRFRVLNVVYDVTRERLAAMTVRNTGRMAKAADSIPTTSAPKPRSSAA